MKHQRSFRSLLDRTFGRWELIYRASQDGFHRETLYEKCDGRGPTLTVAKLKNSETLVGGCTSVVWKRGHYWDSVIDPDAFTFRLEQGGTLVKEEDTEIWMPLGEEDSQFCFPSWGDSYFTSSADGNIAKAVDFGDGSRDEVHIVDFEMFEVPMK